MAQETNRKYDTLWNKVNTLSETKGLTRSALKEVDRIYALAKKEKQQAQIIKALLYQMKLGEQVNDDDNESNFARLQKEIKTAEEPARSILYSFLAEKYLHYFQQHRWQLYSRTKVIDSADKKLQYWSVNDFHENISHAFLSSVKNIKLLQAARLEPFEAIIIKGNARHLRPTLYDLLCHRALDYFSSDENDITKPSYSFEISDKQLFSPAAQFTRLKLLTSDSLSLHHQALLILQELLGFHANDASPDALIDADIRRISLVNQYGVMENKDSLYAGAIQHLTSKYADEPAAAQAWWMLAQWHADKASDYDPLKDTTNRYEYLMALTICKKVILQKQESEGRSNCLALLGQIQQREMNMQTEKVNIPGEPFRALVKFRNIDRLFMRVIPVTEELKNRFINRSDDNYWKQLTTLKSSANWQQVLPVTSDYQKHSAEIKIDALPLGAYLLLASADEQFSVGKNMLAAQLFFISNISYVNNGNEYFVLNRGSGLPMANAVLQTWTSKYGNNARLPALTRGERLLTDNNGYCQMAVNKNNQQNIRLEITHNSDHLFLDDYQYSSYRTDDVEPETADSSSSFENRKATIFFFTDRSIYRPGQTIFFKGIAITKDFETKKNKVYSNQKTIVHLINANGEPVDSLQVTTNEFGSYSGNFRLPENTLNGEFRLKDKNINGDATFSVEEYKRPKFYVEYEKLKATYQVNDSLLVTGSAKAYAGNNINGAMVKYRVLREARFVYPWLYWKWGVPRSSNTEISNGMYTTDENGKFFIRFKAIPDLTVNPRFNPIFDYKVITDVTDINGETRSAETMIPVSYKALQLSVVLPQGDFLPADSIKNIRISTTNLNGEFEPAFVHTTLHRLTVPDRLIRKRYWEQPDQFVLSKAEYLKKFPFDEYRDENDYHNWPREEQVFESNDSTNENASFRITNKNFKDGWYLIEATTQDKYGKEVKDIEYFQLFNEKSKGLPSVMYAINSQNNRITEPGSTSRITIGSSANDVFIIQQVDRPFAGDSMAAIKSLNVHQTRGNYTFFRLSNEKKSFDFPVTEKDRGGFGVYHFFVQNNRFYTLSNQVVVPWTNKELSIGYETFRDKTLPGSGEKWKLKISGFKKEKVAAELLASMFDASLDQFRPHSWSVPEVWPTFQETQSWDGSSNFTMLQSEEKYTNEGSITYYTKNYDRLISTDNDRGVIMFRGKPTFAPPPPAGAALQAKIAGARSTDKLESLQDIQLPGTPKSTPQQVAEQPAIQIRRNFNETAFFLPDLKTDPSGNIEFGFTIPEALTRWKFQALALTKEAAFGYSTKDVVTQKNLMVQPNAPRFLRQGDRLELSTKVVNMTDKEITGTVQLELFNASTMQPVDGWFQNMNANQYFTAEAGKSIPANFTIQVPYQFTNALVYRFIARSSPQHGNDSLHAPRKRATSIEKQTDDAIVISDAEEASIPVLTNKLLVTESMPLPVRGNSEKRFRFENLLRSGASETMQQHALTVEFTTNPAWNVVQALPFLMQNTYDCSEQIFNRFYANAMATKIANSSPRLKAIFNQWKRLPASRDSSKGTDTSNGNLVSNLAKNPELMSALLEETPWVVAAKNETEQKKNIAMLFDTERMSRDLESSLALFKQFQSPDGGFVWFKGGAVDRFMTQYILTGIGHLKKLDALPPSLQAGINEIVGSAIAYLDQQIKEDYNRLITVKTKLAQNNTGYLQFQFGYMRSFFPEYPIPGESFTAINYYRKQSQQFWLHQNTMMQGMIALALNRTGDRKTASDILHSLEQNAVMNEETGMYWKNNRSAYYWYEAPIETQSLMIEAFSEIRKDNKTSEALKTWLLKQKQTRNWPGTKSTADACYALLMNGSDWLSAEPDVEIKLGDKIIKSSEDAKEPGTGFFTKAFEGPFVRPSMGEITVHVSKSTIATNKSADTPPTWGAVYWQYFENLEKVVPSSTPLKLARKLFTETNSASGPVLRAVRENDELHVGDKIKVRIELSADRDLEYIHLKDMRAACLEPVNVLSSYKWQGGLGYYETTKDLSTSFFFNRLPKGSYVFEYTLFVTHTGHFSNGISSIQCMYAPEFSSHSEGINIDVE